MVRDTVRVLRQTALAAFTEYAALYTLRTWLIGWLSRLLMQVSFYALIGRLLGSQEKVAFLVIGNAVYLVAMEACFVVLATVSERRSGTLPLMVAAPATHLTVYLGRGVHYLASGLATSTIALIILPPIFGIKLPWPQAVLILPVLLVIGISSYAYGLTLSCFVLAKPSRRWMTMNLSYLTLLAFAGVNIPLTALPPAVEILVQGLPLTHGLLAVRAIINQSSVSVIINQVFLEALVGVCWFVLATYGFSRAVRSGRRHGTLDFTA